MYSWECGLLNGTNLQIWWSAHRLRVWPCSSQAPGRRSEKWTSVWGVADCNWQIWVAHISWGKKHEPGNLHLKELNYVFELNWCFWWMTWSCPFSLYCCAAIIYNMVCIDRLKPYDHKKKRIESNASCSRSGKVWNHGLVRRSSGTDSGHCNPPQCYWIYQWTQKKNIAHLITTRHDYVSTYFFFRKTRWRPNQTSYCGSSQEWMLLKYDECYAKRCR